MLSCYWFLDSLFSQRSTMSGLTPDDIAFARDQRQNLSLSVAGLVVLFYDYCLTLDLEVAYIWGNPYKRTSAWFLFTRYFTFCINFITLAVMFRNLGPEVCNHFTMAHGFLIGAQQFTVACNLFLRVYAMYDCDKRILIFFMIAALVALGVGVAWGLMPVGPTPPVQNSVPRVHCHSPISKTGAIHLAAAWEADLVWNTIVLGLTMYRAFKLTTNPAFTDSLWHVMIRDGAMYFGIISLISLANILMYYLGDTATFTSLAAITSK
ncbi:hypothetical protein B0H13DRAFT_831916 [Mycena leptocephala]|nr:hypothetical protein B0H13DRAFT_831916 [Mycena leptocephala]